MLTSPTVSLGAHVNWEHTVYYLGRLYMTIIECFFRTGIGTKVGKRLPSHAHKTICPSCHIKMKVTIKPFRRHDSGGQNILNSRKFKNTLFSWESLSEAEWVSFHREIYRMAVVGVAGGGGGEVRGVGGLSVERHPGGGRPARLSTADFDTRFSEPCVRV